MTTPDHLKYSPDHSWVRLEGNVATVGITDYYQGELGDVEFVELPDMGDLECNSPCVVIETGNDKVDVYTPVAGEITEINLDLVTDPAKVNTDPYDTGWIYKMKVDDKSQIERLLDSSSYVQTIR